ncbi:MAG: rhodanese-like domain-containing protein [Bdellovibrionota bacterium]
MKMKWTPAILVALVVAFFAMAGCQTKPTVANDNPDRRIEAAGTSMMKPVEINPETVIIDARAAFDYAGAHVPKSIPMTWSDFTEPEPAQRGILQADLFAITRRLARLGIDPATHVVVAGKGKNGKGEEGRIAWMLSYLGIDNVQFAEIDSLGARFTNVKEANPPKSVAMWKPEPATSLNVTKDEVLFAINKQAIVKAEAYKGTEPRLYKIIDVREEKDYLGHVGLGSKTNIPNMGGINIPWKEFFTETLLPDSSIEKKLKAVGVTEDCRVIVLDQDGVASAAVTMALRSFGYTHAGNYSGGLQDLLGR